MLHTNCLRFHTKDSILQISIPGLHLSLGIFKRLFDLLEQDLDQLDMLIAEVDVEVELVP